MSEIKTSGSHPIYADFIPQDELNLPGRLGMTFAPGMKATSYDGSGWDRDVKMDLKQLHDDGTDILVSLMEDFEYGEGYYRMGGVDSFGRAVEEAGIEFRPFPIRDVDVPRPEQGEEYADLIGGIISDLADGKTVVAHCRGGIGRTGTIAASVLVGLGHDPDEAIDIVRKARSLRMVEATWQEEYVRDFAKGYGGRWSG